MTGIIELRGLRVLAIVGALAEERDRPQPLVIDLDVERPFDDAARSDDLADTTNYADVLARAEAGAREGCFVLLETLAVRVARAVLEIDDRVSAVTVAVRKTRPPVELDVATTGVRVRVTRA